MGGICSMHVRNKEYKQRFNGEKSTTWETRGGGQYQDVPWGNIVSGRELNLRVSG